MTRIASAALLLLADSRFPTGAHAHSGGIESADARGDVRSVDDVAVFLAGRLHTTGTTDATFCAAACAGAHPFAVLDRELAIRTVSPRLRSVSRSLGRQLLRAAEPAWPADTYAVARAVHRDGPLQPLALGLVAAAAGLGPAEAALCSLHHLVGTITTAAVRLAGLDPFAVQALAARVAPQLEQLAETAAHQAGEPPDALPSTTSLLADVLAEHHATWEVRLFAS
jgi:urease accessory protein